MPHQSNPITNHPNEMISPYIVQDDEIDLRELIATLKKRKKTIIITTISALLLAGVYLLVAHPKYEAKATLQIGKQLIKRSDGSIEVKYFEKAKVLKQTLDIKYDTAGKYRDDNVTAYIDNISVPKKTDQFITITALAPSNAEAVSVLQQPINDIMQHHRLYRTSIIEQKRQKLQTFQQELRFIRSQKFKLLRQAVTQAQQEIEQRDRLIGELNTKLQSILSTESALAAIVSIQIAEHQKAITNAKQRILRLQEQIKSLQDKTIPKIQAQIKELNATMHEPYLVPTKVVGKIYTHDKPVKPKKALILIVSLITGMMLGVFLAFFREFIANMQENDPKSSDS